MVEFIKEGDIFALNDMQAYAHGCNCAGAMGKGIALSFRNHYPQMYLEYKDLCQRGEFTPGDVFDYEAADALHIYNLGTQKSWKTKATLTYIRQSLEKMMQCARRSGIRTIAMPAIGAGLGGLKWEDVKQVIADVAAAYPDTDLYVVEHYKG